MDVAEAVTKRVSFRAYEEKAVPADVLAKIVEAGQWAPNAGPFHLSVIRSSGLRRKINDRTREAMARSNNPFLQQRIALPGYEPLYSAPVLILLSAPADAPFGAINTTLAAENMLLTATGLGLASCFLYSPTAALNGENNRDLAGEAALPEGYAVQCAVIVGYPEAENRFGLGERARKGAVSYVD